MGSGKLERSESGKYNGEGNGIGEKEKFTLEGERERKKITIILLGDCVTV